MRSTFYITLVAATALLSGTVDSVVLPQHATNLAQTYKDEDAKPEDKPKENPDETVKGEVDENGNIITDPDAPKGENGHQLTEEEIAILKDTNEYNKMMASDMALRSEALQKFFGVKIGSFGSVKITEQQLAAALDKVDGEHDGQLDLDDLERLITKMGYRVYPATVIDLWTRFHVPNENFIDFKGFKKVVSELDSRVAFMISNAKPG